MVKININNGVSLHSNHSCLILQILVWLCGFVDTMFPPLLILSISDFSIVGKYILNSKELLLPPWVLEPLRSLTSGPSLSWSKCLSPYLYSITNCVNCLCLFYSCYLEPMPLQPFYLLFLKLQTFNVVIVYFNGIIYIYACNRRSKRGMIWWTKIYPNFIALK